MSEIAVPVAPGTKLAMNGAVATPLPREIPRNVQLLVTSDSGNNGNDPIPASVIAPVTVSKVIDPDARSNATP